MENENLEPATDDVVSSLIQDLQSDFDQDTPQEQPQTNPQEAQPTEQQTEQHAEPEKTTSRTEQLLEKARREREYRQREADLETKIETAVASKLEELKVSAQRDSLGTLAQLGIESEDQLKQLAYEIVYKLEGQGAPPEYKAQQSLSEVQRLRKEMEEMQRSMRETYEQQMQRLQAEQQAEKYVGQFTSHVVSNPDQTPHLSKYYKTDQRPL